MKIEYPTYLFGESPDLFKYILNYPPANYEFEQCPEDSNTEKTNLFSHHISRLFNESQKLSVETDFFKKMIANRRVELNLKVPFFKPVLVPSCPIYIGPNPWICEIEHWESLLYPETYSGDIQNTPILKFLKCQFNLPNFRGIITHIKDTVKSLIEIFGESYKDRFFYVPIGYPTPKVRIAHPKTNELRLLVYKTTDSDDLKLLIKAFEMANAKNPRIKLKVVSDDSISKFRLMRHLIRCSVLILPDRVDPLLVVQAMAYQKPVICNDGWGISEYIIDGFNGLIVDKNQESLTSVFLMMVDNLGFIRKMGINGGKLARQKFSNEARNKVLGEIFDDKFIDSY